MANENKLDYKKLKGIKKPLAKVVEVLKEGKTARDNPNLIAEDIAIALRAKSPSTKLSKALGQYSKSAKTEKTIEKEIKDIIKETNQKKSPKKSPPKKKK
jgi:hypothetical protein